MPQQVPSVGRIVHYVIPDGRAPGDHRPAIIVRIWGPPHPGVACQLQVFMDGDGSLSNDVAPNVVWRTSVVQDSSGKLGTWHWPEPVPPIED